MVAFGHRQVGDGHPCFITFEAGPTHDSLASAKTLTKLAADAGADAIKFQILNAERLVADRKLPVSYDVLLDKTTGQTETVTEPIYDVFCRRALTHDEWRELKQYSDSLGLAFFATVTFEEELKLLVDMGCDSIKIASADVNHLPFLRQAAKTGLCLQLDTGNASIGEIEMAVELIRAEGNDNIIVHHCPSGYPARRTGINLNIIPTLKRMFPYPIAFSDHTLGWTMDVAALAMGANLVEKTITLDRTFRSAEHMFSLEPDEMRPFIDIIREVEDAMGSPRRIMHKDELKKRLAARRSIHVLTDLKSGHRLTESNLDYRRPGYGIPPDEYNRVIGAVLLHSKSAGDRLEWSDLA